MEAAAATKGGTSLPPTDYQPPPRFDFTDPTGRSEGLAFLEENGYVVCAGALSVDEVAQGKELFWDFIAGLPERFGSRSFAVRRLGDIKRDDASTWDDMTWPANHRTGIFSSLGANQSPFAWFVRSRPMVKAVFEAVWKDSDLLCSFDAINTFRPWKLWPAWKTSGGWFHVDQNSVSKPDKCCVQGLVSIYDATPSTGGLCVIPGSHKHFVEAGKRIGSGSDHDFVSIPRNDPLLKTPSRLVQCKAGDLLLWDSRTVHCNTPGVDDEQGEAEDKEDSGETNDKQNPEKSLPPVVESGDKEEDAAERSARAKLRDWELLRLVVYVCMTPTKFAEPAVLRERKEMVRDIQGTTHWPHFAYASGPRTPPFASNPYIVPQLVSGNKDPYQVGFDAGEEEETLDANPTCLLM